MCSSSLALGWDQQDFRQSGWLMLSQSLLPKDAVRQQRQELCYPNTRHKEVWRSSLSTCRPWLFLALDKTQFWYPQLQSGYSNTSLWGNQTKQNKTINTKHTILNIYRMINFTANVSSGSSFRSCWKKPPVSQECRLFHSWLPLKPTFDQGSSAFCHLLRTCCLKNAWTQEGSVKNKSMLCAEAIIKPIIYLKSYISKLVCLNQTVVCCTLQSNRE